MRYYLDPCEGGPLWGCIAFAIEVDDEDRVKREVGIDADGRVVHKCPSEIHRYGSQGFWHGFLQHEVIESLDDPSLTPISATDFEKLWNDPALPPPEHRRRRGWRRALDNLSWPAR